MDTKGLRVEVKDASQGIVEAVFSTYDVVDSDGDVTRKGAFSDGAPVRISAYNHASWQGALPVGKGTIHDAGDHAVLNGQFFMDTTAGRDTFTTVKALGDLQEWSYGYDVTKSSYGEFDGKSVRFLEGLKVHEVSPVLLGAGVGTRTLAAKSALKGAVSVHHTKTTDAAWDASAVVAAIASDASTADLKSVFAWVPDGTGISKSACKFPHHMGVGGAANLRACSAAIAALNGGRGGASIPDGDRKAVYAHLAAHLKDAGRTPPELSSAPDGDLKFADEAALVLAGVSDLVGRAKEVMALRAQKGKGLSPQSAELLAWVCDDLAELKALLTESDHEDELARLYARFVAKGI